MFHRSQQPLRQAVRRALASVAMFAQLMLVLAPLVDVHPSHTSIADLVAAARSGGGASWLPAHGPAVAHNAATCPACIAQTIHAQPGAGMPLPAGLAGERAPVEPDHLVVLWNEFPSTYQSRAPPQTIPS